MMIKKEIKSSLNFLGPFDDDIEDTEVIDQMSKCSSKDNNKAEDVDLDELLNMDEDSNYLIITIIGVNEYMEDHEAKKELIQRLLNVSARKNRTEKKKEDNKRAYSRSEDPTNPENEADFKKAYKKLAEKLYDSNSKLVKPEDLQTTNVYLNRRY